MDTNERETDRIARLLFACYGEELGIAACVSIAKEARGDEERAFAIARNAIEESWACSERGAE